MKLYSFIAAVALAQNGPGDSNAERAMSLDKKIDNAQTKCGFYMQKAMTCDPPNSKIAKYTFRFDKVKFYILITNKAEMR